MGFLIRVPLIITGRLSKESGISAYLFAKAVIKLSRKSGLLFTALYFKQCKVCLLQFYGGVPKPKEKLPVLVSLTRSGLPSSLPSYRRKVISRRDARANTVVRWYLSWFSLSKVVLLSKKFSKDNLETVTATWTSDEGVISIIKEIYVKVRDLFDRYAPWIRDIPVIQGMSWEPTWKSLPNSREWAVWKGNSKGGQGRKPDYFEKITGPLTSLLLEIGAFSRFLSHDGKIRGLETSISGMWAHRLRWPFVPITWQAWRDDNLSFVRGPYRLIAELVRPLVGTIARMGKLAGVTEGGGKLRLFLIGNYIKQRLLKPYHDWAMSVLRRLPGDGTYHQTKPLARLRGRMEVYSYDRLPPIGGLV